MEPTNTTCPHTTDKDGKDDTEGVKDSRQNQRLFCITEMVQAIRRHRKLLPLPYRKLCFVVDEHDYRHAAMAMLGCVYQPGSEAPDGNGSEVSTLPTLQVYVEEPVKRMGRESTAYNDQTYKPVQWVLTVKVLRELPTTDGATIYHILDLDVTASLRSSEQEERRRQQVLRQQSR